MTKSNKFKLRLTIAFTEHAVLRVSVRERTRNGKFELIERPWGIKELAGLKLAAKAAVLVSRGVSRTLKRFAGQLDSTPASWGKSRQ